MVKSLKSHIKLTSVLMVPAVEAGHDVIILIGMTANAIELG
jgi:hypothetical protein